MRILVFFAALLISDPIGNLNRVAKTNAIKKEAKAAFEAKDYKTAIEKYSFLVDSLQVKDDHVILNLANSYYKIADSSQALSNYQKLTSSSDTKIQSLANQQLGVMSTNPKQLQTSLDYFKKALKADPGNEEARYNYELVKKLIEEQKKKDQEKKDQNKDKDKDKKEDQEKKKDQEKKDEQNKDQKEKDKEEKDKEKGDKQDQEKQEKSDKDQEQQEQDKQKQEQQKKDQEKKEGEQDDKNKEENKDKKKEMPQSTKEKLQQMKISPEKAKMILEAMKNQEVQYIQQSKKKAKRKSKNNKPDW